MLMWQQIFQKLGHKEARGEPDVERSTLNAQLMSAWNMNWWHRGTQLKPKNTRR